MSIDHIKAASRKAKGKRPIFFEDRQAERVLNMVMALAGELAVTRERLDTVERLLAASGQVKRADIEAFTPDADAAKERQLAQQEFIARVMRIVQQEREGLEENAAGQPDVEAIITTLSK